MRRSNQTLRESSCCVSWPSGCMHNVYLVGIDAWMRWQKEQSPLFFCFASVRPGFRALLAALLLLLLLSRLHPEITEPSADLQWFLAVLSGRWRCAT